ncbi:uncharacterized protein V6R79_011577 [Siganus canaliculatus]
MELPLTCGHRPTADFTADSTSVFTSVPAELTTMSVDKTIVFFDLEATGLDTHACDIIQLSAVCGQKVFNAYTLPRSALTESAKRVTGFTVRDGSLFLRGAPVDTIPLIDLLTSFLTFLRSFHQPVLLAAHSVTRFDAPVLTRVLRQYSLQQEFQQVVSGFLDTFLLSKNVYRGLGSYSQQALVRHFLGKTYDAHNAMEDAGALQELFNAWNPNKRTVSRFVFSGGEESQQQPLVFFDLETTGLGQGCEIVQLAAVSGGHSINLYITPRCRMQQGASRVTGFRVRRQRLYLHRQLVLTNSLREVLVSFIAFLHMLGRPLLIGHNIRRFDCPLLTRALDETGLRPQFEASISGCVDTLPLAREMLKDRGLQSFRQESLVSELLGVNYKAHDALEDVRALQALYSVLQPTPELMCRHSFTLETTENKAAAKCKVTCKAPEQQRPLWENFRQTLKVTESEESKR